MVENKLKRYFTAKRVAYLGVSVALSVVANIFTIFVSAFGSNSISFTYLVTALAGILLGPVSGGIVGGLGDVLGHFIAPQGAFNPFITLSSVLIGVIAGLIFKIKKLNPYIKIAVAYAVIFVVCTSGINTFGLWLYYVRGKKTFWVYYAGRAPFQLIIWAINLALTFVTYKPLSLFISTDKKRSEPISDKANENN